MHSVQMQYETTSQMWIQSVSGKSDFMCFVTAQTTTEPFGFNLMGSKKKIKMVVIQNEA